VQVGVSQNTILDLKNQQDAAKTSITSRQSSLQDANMAQVVTQLQQIQTALQAALTARSITQQKNLFDYLG
jgi:flagellin-like hook-associated protein FlgL